jgi:hypothetical protein
MTGSDMVPHPERLLCIPANYATKALSTMLISIAVEIGSCYTKSTIVIPRIARFCAETKVACDNSWLHMIPMRLHCHTSLDVIMRPLERHSVDGEGAFNVLSSKLPT